MFSYHYLMIISRDCLYPGATVKGQFGAVTLHRTCIYKAATVRVTLPGTRDSTEDRVPLRLSTHVWMCIRVHTLHTQVHTHVPTHKDTGLLRAVVCACVPVPAAQEAEAGESLESGARGCRELWLHLQ